MSGLNVWVQYFFSTTHQAARILVILQNPSPVAANVTVQVPINFGSDSNTTVGHTSSGDTTVTTADRWVVTSDGGAGRRGQYHSLLWTRFSRAGPNKLYADGVRLCLPRRYRCDIQRFGAGLERPRAPVFCRPRRYRRYGQFDCSSNSERHPVRLGHQPGQFDRPAQRCDRWHFSKRLSPELGRLVRAVAAASQDRSRPAGEQPPTGTLLCAHAGRVRLLATAPRACRRAHVLTHGPLYVIVGPVSLAAISRTGVPGSTARCERHERSWIESLTRGCQRDRGHRIAASIHAYVVNALVWKAPGRH